MRKLLMSLRNLFTKKLGSADELKTLLANQGFRQLSIQPVREIVTEKRIIVSTIGGASNYSYSKVERYFIVFEATLLGGRHVRYKHSLYLGAIRDTFDAQLATWEAAKKAFDEFRQIQPETIVHFLPFEGSLRKARSLAS